MATRQNSTNGKPKSPRIQVVLPESICDQLTLLAEEESRTISNMAKVLIQEGIKKYFEKENNKATSNFKKDTDAFRNSLEKQSVKRLKGAPQRIKYIKNSENQ